MNKFIIETIKSNDIYEQGFDRFNSNNHYGDTRPDDYYNSIELTHTINWIDKFKDKYKKIIINDNYHIEWLKKAFDISTITGEFSEIYKDDLDEFVKKYDDDKIFDGTKYFIRCEGVSLKCGKHGAGPYIDMKSIVESLVSCTTYHTPIYHDTCEIVLYIIPWETIEKHMEFRVFVHENKITAISQQCCYDCFDDILNDDVVTEYINILLNNFDEDVSKKLTLQNNYTYDIAILNTDNGLSPYFIEQNVFGKEYAAGSSLFHWIIDEEILYQKGTPVVYFRYVKN
jgi:hypothetical protein